MSLTKIDELLSQLKETFGEEHAPDWHKISTLANALDNYAVRFAAAAKAKDTIETVSYSTQIISALNRVFEAIGYDREAEVLKNLHMVLSKRIPQGQKVAGE